MYIQNTMSEGLRCQDRSRCILDNHKIIVQMVLNLEKLNGPEYSHEVLLNNLLNFMSDMSEMLRSQGAYSINEAF